MEHEMKPTFITLPLKKSLTRSIQNFCREMNEIRSLHAQAERQRFLPYMWIVKSYYEI